MIVVISFSIQNSSLHGFDGNKNILQAVFDQRSLSQYKQILLIIERLINRCFLSQLML
jgi:hypothetical protein